MRPIDARCGNGEAGTTLWGAGLALLVALAMFLAACARERGGMPGGSRWIVPQHRVPVVFVPGISGEVASFLRGGALAPFSSLALRTNGEALANLGDPRFPADGTSAVEVPRVLDRALRRTEVRELQRLIDHLVREEAYVRGNLGDPRDKDYPENPSAGREDRTHAASLFVVYYDWRRDLTESACVLSGVIGLDIRSAIRVGRAMEGGRRCAGNGY